MDITVDYKDCQFDITVTNRILIEGNPHADSDWNYYGWDEIYYDFNSITAMAYDEDGNALHQLMIDMSHLNDYDGDAINEFLASLWDAHGIDVQIDWDEFDNIVKNEYDN